MNWDIAIKLIDLIIKYGVPIGKELWQEIHDAIEAADMPEHTKAAYFDRLEECRPKPDRNYEAKK